MRAREAIEALRQYNEALDLFLKETQRPSAGKTIINLARSLPEHVWIKEMVIETESTPMELHEIVCVDPTLTLSPPSGALSVNVCSEKVHAGELHAPCIPSSLTDATCHWYGPASARGSAIVYSTTSSALCTGATGNGSPPSETLTR